MTKFLKSISTTCIPNYPDANLPTLFIYKDGNMEKQFVGPIELRGMKLTEEGLYFFYKLFNFSTLLSITFSICARYYSFDQIFHIILRHFRML